MERTTVDGQKKVKTYDLSKLEWKVSGWIPYVWRLDNRPDIGTAGDPEIRPLVAKVPGSVQWTLRNAGIIPDWNQGLQGRQCEWVENRHWIYEARIPNEWIDENASLELVCEGLDYSGWILINNKEIATFKGSHVPHIFHLSSHLQKENNFLQIVFDCPPRWLGQFGFTSQMTEWKIRFNYMWDWTGRIVQIGIWDPIYIRAVTGWEISKFQCTTTADAARSTGSVSFFGMAVGNKDGRVRVSLEKKGSGTVVKAQDLSLAEFNSGITWLDIPVELWWPNGLGKQALYTLKCQLLDEKGNEMETVTRQVGFRSVEWQSCEGAPKEADPWLCVVNGKPVFLQGVNWVPPVSNLADVTESDYRLRLELYRDLGMNILRVWGGSVPEREVFYNMCDELGIFVWQEFPLSSSGADNWPPEDQKSINELSEIAISYIDRRQHHASLLVWCGGNELLGNQNGSKIGSDKPCDCSHPLLAALQEIVARKDPNRRFLPCSPSGPRTWGGEKEFGQGLHWDVHGPWKWEGKLDTWAQYWAKDDALFRSEIGSPSASPIDILEKYKGECETFPCNKDNPLWTRPISWWIEWQVFKEEMGRDPKDLAEYVNWSQERQKQALCIAVKACKDRFPRCGGVILWMGHDCFPCAANTAIVDFHGRPKPAAIALSKIYKRS